MPRRPRLSRALSLLLACSLLGLSHAQVYAPAPQAETPKNIDPPARDLGQHTEDCIDDPRACVDVVAYDFALDFSGSGSLFSGKARIEMQARHNGVQLIQMDAGNNLRLKVCSLQLPDEAPMRVLFSRIDEGFGIKLDDPLLEGQTLVVTTGYGGDLSNPGGLAWHAERTKNNALRVDTNLQYAGAHHLFPCKAAHFHPEDTALRTKIEVKVPGGLEVVAPGTRKSKVRMRDGSTRFSYELPHAVPTWAMGIAIGPFQVEERAWRDGAKNPIQIEVYRLPGTEKIWDRALDELPAILTHLETIFGPYPFPDQRLALVETQSFSPVNATWTGLSSKLIAAAAKGKDPDGSQYQNLIRVLSHELGHSWWGHGLSVASWRDSWLHESFASYGELLYLGVSQGLPAQERAFGQLAASTSPKHRLAMCGRSGRNAATASAHVLWCKGPWVLRSLQFELDNDALWFDTLARFQSQYRFKTVRTEDLMECLEQSTEQSWERFFDEWFEGRGAPHLKGTVEVSWDKISLHIENLETPGLQFHVPIDLVWSEAGQAQRKRILLHPGSNHATIASHQPKNVQVEGLDQVLAQHYLRIITVDGPR